MGTPSDGNDTTTQDMVERCVAAILPTIRETIRDVISGPSTSPPQPQSSQENQEFNSSSLQMITGTSKDKKMISEIIVQQWCSIVKEAENKFGITKITDDI